MSRLVHFEIHVDDIERAKAFYESAFGWTFEDWSRFSDTEYWGVITGPGDQAGIDGGMLKRRGPRPEQGQPVNAFVCTVQVDDYDETERRILEAGGQTAVAKTALAGMAWQGYYIDPEGNLVGIHQPDPDAA